MNRYRIKGIISYDVTEEHCIEIEAEDERTAECTALYHFETEHLRCVENAVWLEKTIEELPPLSEDIRMWRMRMPTMSGFERNI